MDETTVKGGFLLIMGIGLLAIALQGLARGELPTGSRSPGGDGNARRDQDPALFWLFFLLYSAGGGGLAAYALRLLAA